MGIIRHSGIIEISFCLTGNLSIDHQGYFHPEARSIRASGNFQNIPIVGVGGYQVTSEIANKETIYTTKLTFTMGDCESSREVKRILSSHSVAFKLTNTLKGEYLLGTDKKPFPIPVIKSNNENKSGGKVTHEVEITYVNRLELLPIG